MEIQRLKVHNIDVFQLAVDIKCAILHNLNFNMRVAEVGNTFKLTEKIDFFSSKTVMEYDAIIIDVDYIPTGYSIPALQKRAAHLKEFATIKNVPIIYLSPQKFNLQLANVVGAYIYPSLDQCLPIPKLGMESEGGNKFEIKPNTIFTDFLKKYATWFAYEHFYSANPGITIVTTPYTNKSLGFYTTECVFLPKITAIDSTLEREFLEDLLKTISRIHFQPGSNPLPEWSDAFYLPTEQEAVSEIKMKKEKIEALAKEVDENEKVLELLKHKKQLFTATGTELEYQVQVLFEELGFEILEADRNRGDLIVKYIGKPAVIEIKGVNGSAGERNSAQLEKWRIEYLEKNDVTPKGILVVNAFRETSIDERNQESFPDQMLRFATGREHCLITTLQLLAIYYEVKLHPEKKDEIIQSLFDTVGRYPDTYKWQDYISADDKPTV